MVSGPDPETPIYNELVMRHGGDPLRVPRDADDGDVEDPEDGTDG